MIGVYAVRNAWRILRPREFQRSSASRCLIGYEEARVCTKDRARMKRGAEEIPENRSARVRLRASSQTESALLTL